MKFKRSVTELSSFVLMFALFALVFLGKAVAEEPASLDMMLAKIAPPISMQALEKIPEPGRKLLALRSYLRYGAKIADRWSWTDAEIKAFQGSPEQKALLADIAAVNDHFKAANPGFEIYVHGTVRSLDEQLASWNKNASVGAEAEEILEAHRIAFGEEGLRPEKIDVKKLDAWLRSYSPSKRANLAAPGLTLHGRAHAIDFQVMKSGSIYAGANTRQVETIWRAEGWDQKLKASIIAAGPSFTGPLTNPDEPWHYDYQPSAAAASSK